VTLDSIIKKIMNTLNTIPGVSLAVLKVREIVGKRAPVVSAPPTVTVRMERLAGPDRLFWEAHYAVEDMAADRDWGFAITAQEQALHWLKVKARDAEAGPDGCAMQKLPHTEGTVGTEVTASRPTLG
jgi:hypothetical protein